MTVRKKVPVPLNNGVTATFVTFDFDHSKDDHIALLFKGWDSPTDTPLVRIHSECLTGDVFGSERCDCHAQLHEAIDTMSVTGGVLLYLRQEGRGIGLKAKLDAYDLQINHGMDTFEANRALGHTDDGRDYAIAAEMLKALNIPSVRLLTNNPQKVSSLMDAGIDVQAIQPTVVHVTQTNEGYLDTKIRHGHNISLLSSALRKTAGK